MKRVAFSVTFLGVLFGLAYAAPSGSVSSFLSHPTHCVQLLGGADHASNEPVSAEFSTALSAALDAPELPTERAVDALKWHCAAKLALPSKESLGVRP